MTNATAAQTAASRQKLLDAARALFLAQGYAATSLEHICERAGLTKGCFFHHFENKAAIGRALLAEWSAQSAEKQRALFGDDPDPLERVYHYVDGYAELARRGALGKGCLLAVFAGELMDVPEIRSACGAGFASWSGHLAEELKAARKKHAPGSRIDANALAEHFVALIEGAILISKARRDPGVIVSAAKQYRDYVARIFEAERTKGEKP